MAAKAETNNVQSNSTLTTKLSADRPPGQDKLARLARFTNVHKKVTRKASNRKDKSPREHPVEHGVRCQTGRTRHELLSKMVRDTANLATALVPESSQPRPWMPESR